MSLWKENGSWVGRRPSAIPYVKDYGGAPLPCAWDWAACSLEFAAPSPLIRLSPMGSAPTEGHIASIPTLAKTEKETNPTTPRRQSPMHHSNGQPIQGGAPLNLEEPAPPRVRLETDTRVPTESASRGASKIDPATHDQKLSMWMATGKGKTDPNMGQRRGVRREAPLAGKQEGKGSPGSSSSRPSRWHAWNYDI